MSTRLPLGIVTLSVDWRAGDSRTNHATPDAGRWLLDRLSTHKIDATWGLEGLEESALATAHRLSAAGQDIALMDKGAPAGSLLGQADFARRIRQQIAAMKTSGVMATTLVLPAPPTAEQCDVASRHGLLAVRHASEHARRWQPKAMRFGLWSFPTAITLPRATRWWPGGGGSRAVRRDIDTVIASRAIAPVAIDLTQLARRGGLARGVVERVLQHLARRRDEGRLEVLTVNAAAMRLASLHQGRPSRSILRPAA